MDTSESVLVTFSVKFDVSGVLSLEFLHHIINVGHTFLSASHGLGGEVGVATTTVPVWEELWLKGNGHVVLLSASHKEESSSPEVITLIDTSAWSDLKLPLSWHNFTVGSGDGDSSVQAALVVSISDGSSEANVTSNGAVVWSLISWVTSGGPSIRSGAESAVFLKNSVLLLDSEPWFLGGVGIEDLFGEMSEIGVRWDKFLVGGIFPGKSLDQNHDVVATSEWIWEHEHWLHDDLRVLGSGLVA